MAFLFAFVVEGKSVFLLVSPSKRASAIRELDSCEFPLERSSLHFLIVDLQGRQDLNKNFAHDVEIDNLLALIRTGSKAPIFSFVTG